jgi:hypothetical protein
MLVMQLSSPCHFIPCSFLHPPVTSSLAAFFTLLSLHPMQLSSPCHFIPCSFHQPPDTSSLAAFLTLLSLHPLQLSSPSCHFIPCSFLHPPITSSLAAFFTFLSLHPSSVQIISSALYYQTPWSTFVPYSQDQDSHPYRTTGKIIVLYILIFTFFDSRRED